MSSNPAERARDASLFQVAEHAPEKWRRTAWAILQRVAATHDAFTTDDLIKCGCPVPPEPRAFGALMRAGVRAKIIEPTGQYVPSDRVESHSRPKRQWRKTQEGKP